MRPEDRESGLLVLVGVLLAVLAFGALVLAVLAGAEVRQLQQRVAELEAEQLCLVEPCEVPR